MTNAIDSKEEPLKGRYTLVRILFCRLLGFVYFAAFLSAYHQYPGLLSDQGLMPVNVFLDRTQLIVPPNGRPLQPDLRTQAAAYRTLERLPTVAWFFPPEVLDSCMMYMLFASLCVSGAICVLGWGHPILWLFLWISYKSLVTVGQTWYSFGWEMQLCETGFLAIFVSSPLMFLSRSSDNGPGYAIPYLYRWLMLRIMLGAGLIKLRGDACWLDLTCMRDFYETQPIPNPLAFYFHFTPKWFHSLEVVVNHLMECVAPFFAFIPYSRSARAFCGAAQIFFMAILISAGNLSFLNWLTMVPSLWCFDDAHVKVLFTRRTIEASLNRSGADRPRYDKILLKGLKVIVHTALLAVVVVLSVPVVENLLSRRQAMNTSYDPLGLVNSYGNFGSITKERFEIVVEGSHDGATWKEYEFMCKPGDVRRRPCAVSPYHYRLDWLMWFAAMGSYQHNPWVLHLAAKMLRNDAIVNPRSDVSLIRVNPFILGEDDQTPPPPPPPKYLRMMRYKYKMVRPSVFTEMEKLKLGWLRPMRGPKDVGGDSWWHRTPAGEYLPVVSLENLQPALEQFGWSTTKDKKKGKIYAHQEPKTINTNPSRGRTG